MNSAHRTASRAKRQQWADPAAWIKAIARQQEQPEENATRIAGMVRLAFERLRIGAGRAKDYNLVAHAFNVALVRAGLIDPLAEGVMQAGANAMNECDDIFNRHGRYGFTGPGQIAACDALDLYESILRQSTPGQMESAVSEVARRMIQQGQAA